MRHGAIVALLLTMIAHGADVRTERVPEGGVQPQVVSGPDGILHLVYLKTEAKGSDVCHAWKHPGTQDWSAPVKVNTLPGSAVATGTIRGAQFAIGKDSTVHVVWNGPGGKDQPAPLYYAQSLDGGHTFKPQRDLRGDTRGLDGGATIAASPQGEVFIVWHGARAEAAPGEVNRVVFVLKSTDNGTTFAPVKIANLDDLGVCACCSLKSFVTPAGELLTLYRAARKMAQRDVTLLVSRDGGESFTHRIVGPWSIAACPMSSMTMAQTDQQTRGAWETEGMIYTALVDHDSDRAPVAIDKGRHPALAVNSDGKILISWSIGTGWQKGGKLGWAVLDKFGKPTGEKGASPGVPVWGMTAAYAEGPGFVVMY